MPHNMRRGQPAPDWAIPGDEQEESRRRLEQDVLARVGDITFENTDTHSTEYSIEYPRHRGQGDGAFSSGADAFPSYSTHGHHDLSHFDGDVSRVAPDFRSLHGGDDSVMHVGETFSSTLNHHASAVTLGAGLGGPPGRTPSRSNIAEFDPERRLPDLLDGRGRSLLDDSGPLEPHQNSKPLRHKPFMPSFSTADPIIVEDTAELDRALELGQFEVHNAASAEPHRDDFGYGESDPEDGSASTLQHSEAGSSAGGRGPRATLTDTLGNGRAGAFSPKRPRSAQGFHRSERAPQLNMASTHTAGGASQFTEAARGLTKEIERERQDADRAAAKFFAGPKDPAKPTVDGGKRTAKATTDPRDPLTDVRNRRHGPSRTFQFPRNTSVHLPDVTGLTSAVATPNKVSRRYRHVKQGSADVTMVKATIEQLATRLRELETENITSRRRVRELELDLEKCRADVARERTRVQAEIQKQLSQTSVKERDRKGKGRADEPIASSSKPTNPEELRVWEARYKEVVDTKKALESLVTSLRTQLAQMTAELEEQRKIVEELRSLREQDEAEIFQRCQEVEDLREEVERLGGEVHRLRSIVEESVRERRDAAQREENSYQSEPEDEQSLHPQNNHLLHVRQQVPNALSPVPEESSQDPQLLDTRQTDDDPGRASRPSSRLGGINRRPVDDSLASNDGFEFRSRATVGSSGRTARRFISLSELERVESDVEERRSFLSGRSVVGDDEASQVDIRPKSPAHPAGPSRLENRKQQPPRRSRLDPEGPSKTKHGKESEAFPQIRGARMEKLFFSLPDHNESTCHVCRRRGANRAVTDPEWHQATPTGPHAPPHQSRKNGPGFTDVDAEELLDAAAAAFDRARLRRDRDDSEDGELPPQAVLARVLRELEDDFMHFKSTYIELAEQYGKMDPASNILKRHVLADHLREVIETLEEKEDQIASLYDLLSFKDKPDAAVPLLSRRNLRTRHTTNAHRQDGTGGVPVDVKA